MDMSSSSTSSSTFSSSTGAVLMHPVSRRQPAVPAITLSSSSSSQSLYYYNVDAILSDLIRPATPKHGNLARPRLVKPEPIRPQQLMSGIGGYSSSSTLGVSTSSRRYHNNNITSPFALLNDRTEGARNPDPIQQQIISPFAMDDDDDDDEDVEGGRADIGMTTTTTTTYSNGAINKKDQYYNGSSSKRSRDDEDILYYKKSLSNKSIITSMTTTEEMDDTTGTTAATLVTPNPIQYYTSISSSVPTVTHTQSLPLPEEPQFIVYKNFIDDDIKNSVGTRSSSSNDDSHHHHNNYFHHGNNSNNNSNQVWTTTGTPSTTVSYTIVKPIAMRPMDVIQHLDHDYYHHHNDNNGSSSTTASSTTSQDTNSCQTLTKNLLYSDVLEDGSMQVCG